MLSEKGATGTDEIATAVKIQLAADQIRSDDPAAIGIF